MNDKEIKEMVEKVETLLGGSDTISLDLNDPAISDKVVELRKARNRLELSKKGLAVEFDAQGGTMTVFRIGSVDPAPKSAKAPEKSSKKPKKRPAPKRHQHSYVAPRIAKDIIDLLVDAASYIIQLVGPTQCGKTTIAKYVAGELGRKFFKINCRGDMDSAAFIGEKTIEVEEVEVNGETKPIQKISYQKGIIEKAMTEGLDENGQEVGPAGLLLIDEITACPANVAHVLNGLFESDDPRRTLILDQDGGRVVRSHSQFRIIVAGNTAGRGAQEFSDSVYAAQLDALDLSLLHRISACFRMGYDRKVEKHILAEKIGDDKVAQLVISFRDAIRSHIKSGKLTSPFSTKNIVDIANLYRVFGNLGKAIYYAVFEHLLPEERAVYNETAVTVFAKDLMKEHVEPEVDYL